MNTDSIEADFIISKFMGYTYPDINSEVFRASLDLHNYHEDWNKLMEVVEKIGEYGRWNLHPGFATLELYPERGIGMCNKRQKKVKFSTSEMDWETDNGEPVGWKFLVFQICVQFIKTQQPA